MKVKYTQIRPFFLGFGLSLLFNLQLMAMPSSSPFILGIIQPAPIDLQGTVVDEDGEPLIGVNVLVKGTNKGTANEFKIGPHHALWPIPQDVIDDNPGGVINQNEGYPGFENNIPPLTEITDEQ